MTLPRANTEAPNHDRDIDAILASFPDGFVALDNDWRITRVNAATERIWRQRASELIGRTVAEALGAPPDNVFQVIYADSKRTGETAVFSAPSAIYGVWFEVRGYPNPRGYSIFFRDITEERLVHRKIREAERKLEAQRLIN